MFRGVVGRDLVAFPPGESKPAEQKIGEQGGENEEPDIEPAVGALQSEADRNVSDSHSRSRVIRATARASRLATPRGGRLRRDRWRSRKGYIVRPAWYCRNIPRRGSLGRWRCASKA